MKASRASEITQEQINGALKPLAVSHFPILLFQIFQKISGSVSTRFSISVRLSVTYGAGPSSGEHPLPPV